MERARHCKCRAPSISDSFDTRSTHTAIRRATNFSRVGDWRCGMTLVLAANPTPGGMPSAMAVPTALYIPREVPSAEDCSIDTAVREAFQDWRDGRISEVERDRILAELDARRSAIARPSPQPQRLRKFRPRRYRRSPDRQKSHERRAGLAADYDAMPPQIRRLFNEAGAAVLAVMAYEHQSKGRCELHVEAIAAKAGVCVRTVQNTRKRAAELGLIDPRWERRIAGRKSLTNVIKIIAADWLAHLAR